MPTPQTPQARRTSQQLQKPKSLDLGKNLGLYDTATVRQKIRKWQTTGGGVVTAEDALATESEKEEKSEKSARSAKSDLSASKAKSRSRPRSKTASEPNLTIVDPPRLEGVDPPTTPISKSEIKSTTPATEPTKPRIIERKPRNHLDEEVWQAIAPKKRVVSDGHWRRRRSPPKAAAVPKSPPKPDPKLVWVRPPLLPRPSDEPEPPKPKPPPKPIRVIVPRPRAKVFIDREETDPSDTEEEIVRTKTPTTPRPNVSARASRPKIDNSSPRAYRSDDDTPPKRQRPSQRRAPSPHLDDPYSSPDDRRKSRKSYAKSGPSSPDDVYKNRRGNRRRSLSVEDVRRSSRDRHNINRQSSISRSPKSGSSDEGFARRRRKSHRKGMSDGEGLSDPEPNSPPRQLTNHDDEAARRRATIREEYARFTPKETLSADRRRSRRKKEQAPEVPEPMPEPIPQPIPRPPVHTGNPETPPRVFSTRVEAWLTGTPDPFLEPAGEARKARREAREAREARKTPRDSKRVFSFEPLGKDAFTEPSTIGTETIDTETVDTETIATETIDTESRVTEPRRRSSRTPRSSGKERSSPSTPRAMDRNIRAQSEPSSYLDPEIEVEYSSTTSVPALKRSGARKGSQTPTKERVKSLSSAKSYTESDIASSVVSSSVDPSSFDPPDIQLGDGSASFAARRLFPSTGKRLSTIASVETFNTKAQQAPPSIVSEGSEDTALPPEQPNGQSNDDKVTELPNLADPSIVSATRSRTSLKRKLTTHADLISVLSMPASRSKSIVSARSIRTHRSRLETATIEDLMKELSSDEAKYMRELRTLADGVIPVLLKCVLSKSEAAITAGLFNRSQNSDKEAIADAQKAIRDMSVAIQRLKSLHTRIPKESHFSFLIWAQSALNVYEKYVKTWRLGFQDVVVSLATEEEGSTITTPKSADGSAWEQGLPRNEDGYIVDGDGDRVDVAFLLKRPLVRLKYLAKTLKGINIKKPSDQAGVLSKKFQDLMEFTRERVNQEKARMEDEAAALIDATRARDPKSLAPLSGIRIDPARCVRARDYFDLNLLHSSGQEVDCRVELLMRDDAAGRGDSGDVLVCEVDETGRWLLFPPIQFNRISARAGDEPGDIVVMIRGVSSSGQDWDELLTLRTQDEEVRFEWIQMLGLSPVPPSLNRTRSFKLPEPRPASSHGSSLLSGSTRSESTVPLKSRTPSPRAIEVPIGEQAGSNSKRWGHDATEWRYGSSDISSVSSAQSSHRAARHPKPKDSDVSYASWSTYNSRSDTTEEPRQREKLSPTSDISTPKSLNDAMEQAGSGSPSLRRTRAKRYRSSPSSPDKPTPLSPPDNKRVDEVAKPRSSPSAERIRTPSKSKTSASKHASSKGFSVWIPPTSEGSNSDESDEDEDSYVSSVLPKRPQLHRRASSVPSMQLPTIPKVRKADEPTNLQTPTKQDSRGVSLPAPSPREVPASAPSKSRKNSPFESKSAPVSPDTDKPPPPPPHRTPSSSQVKFAPTPQFTPTSQLKRRSSSPLKHEYQPSSPSSSSSLSEESASEYSDESITSESDDGLDDDDDVVSSLVPSVLSSRLPSKAPETIYSLPNATIKPSESASQAPYRTVPQQFEKAVKSIATIFCWSDRGQWELLHPDECSVVIGPGIIKAYEMTDEHSSESEPKERPLVALELTPLVPLRRGTALDITIRSPPTPASRLKPGNNIMFRARSPEDCEALYGLINKSRINNPTYIALQNARPPTGESSWAAVMDRPNTGSGSAAGGNSGWWHFGNSTSRSKSYRASTRAPSTAGNTESSVGTISSVMAAMKRFSGTSKILDAAKSRMSVSRDSGSLDSGGSGARSPPFYVDPAKSGGVPAGVGITNAKIRLYVREPRGSKWLDLGSSRLSIMQRDQGSGVDAPLMLQTGAEKRIIVVGKSGKDVLLDVTLGESCFERVARTGIAVSVWEDVVAEGGGGVAATGGVAEKRVRIYMIQLKSERECAYTFSLLGKLRY